MVAGYHSSAPVHAFLWPRVAPLPRTPVHKMATLEPNRRVRSLVNHLLTSEPAASAGIDVGPNNGMVVNMTEYATQFSVSDEQIAMIKEWDAKPARIMNFSENGRHFSMSFYRSDMVRLAARANKKSAGLGGPSSDGEYICVGAPVVYNKRIKRESGSYGAFCSTVKMAFKQPEATRWGLARFAASIERGVSTGSLKSLVNVNVTQMSPALAMALFTWDNEADAKAGQAALSDVAPSGITPAVDEFCDFTWMSGSIDQTLVLD